MKIQSLLERKLQDGLQPALLEIVNESPRHNVPKKAESHFRALIVSDKFAGLNLIQRHQMVHRLISEPMREIHAFSQQTLTLEEFKKKGGVLPSSPPCAKK